MRSCHEYRVFRHRKQASILALDLSHTLREQELAQREMCLREDNTADCSRWQEGTEFL